MQDTFATLLYFCNLFQLSLYQNKHEVLFGDVLNLELLAATTCPSSAPAGLAVEPP